MTSFDSEPLSMPRPARSSNTIRAMIMIAWMLGHAIGFGSSLTSSAWGQETSTPKLRPWADNPWYWSFDNQPVLLLGGSDDDNLFQWPADQLIPQLDRIADAGGNVVRNTMSDRKDKGFELYAFAQNADGKYDLDRWNEEYWERFELFLNETSKRKIFVQIEVWDRFDYTDSSESNRWAIHPYNPANNVNYSYDESGFAPEYPDHPGANRQPFFFTTPDQRNNEVVLKYQRNFVDKMLSISLQYDHVLYCIDNETGADEEWGQYWARHLKQRATEAGKSINVTEMWDDWDLQGEQHRRTFDHPELYDFVDVSQNNQNSGRKHWNQFLYVREQLSVLPRPINTTKTYGADGNKFGHSNQDGIERFWRHLLAGAASMRFHRPDSGLGINDKAVAAIRAARILEADIPLWTVEPAADLLPEVEDNSAYLAANPGVAYALFVTAIESDEPKIIKIDLSQAVGEWKLKWIDIDAGSSGEVLELTAGHIVELTVPSTGNWAASITPKN